MPILATCGCGKSYDLKDEFAGRAVKCPAMWLRMLDTGQRR